MKTIAEQILEAVLQPLNTVHHELTNDSHKHSGSATDSHFSLLIVSPDFAGMLPVKRHQKVYQLVNHLMANPIHALALHCYTPEQWQDNKIKPNAPDCMGLNKG